MVGVVDYALWIDLETTGLESTSSILEIGALLVENRPPFEVVDAYTTIVTPTDPDWRSEMIAFVTSMHTKTGLLSDLDAASSTGNTVSLADAEKIILLMLDRAGVTPSNPAYLGGSGVSHFDQRVLAAQMPALSKRLRYATLDVGVLRRWLDSVGRSDLTEVNYGSTFVDALPENQQHRAFADILDHLNEFRAYSKMAESLVVPEPQEDLTDE